MGLDIYLRWKEQAEEERRAAAMNELPSGEITYLRSAYNDDGFNTWCRQQLKGRSLHWFLQLEDDKCVEMKFDDGTTEQGLVPDWDECRQRTIEALEYARQIPDSLYTISLQALLDKVDALVDCEDVVEEYRRLMDERKDRLKEMQAATNQQVETLPAGFKDGYGYVFEKPPTNVKSVFLCRMNRWPCLVMICEGKPDLHQPYIEMLQETVRFIDSGRRRRGWITWSG